MAPVLAQREDLIWTEFLQMADYLDLQVTQDLAWAAA